MSVAAVSVDAKRLPSPALRRFAWGVLAYFIAVILWGTLVRATGSGAGCGNHWPLCNGTVMQHSASVETLIEFTHRLTSGLSLFSVLGLLVWTYKGTVRGHLARAAAVASVGFTVVEAILGALLVKLGLTAQSQSPLRPAYLALHLTNTLLLLAALTLASHLLSRRKGFLRGSITLVAPFGAIAAVVVIRLFMMLMPSSDMLFWISRVPAPLKSSPGGVPVAEDLVPCSTPGVVRAIDIGSRPAPPFIGSSARLLITSETLASSVLIALAVAWTVTDSTTLPTFRVTSFRTTWLISTWMRVTRITSNPGCSTLRS